MTIRTRDMSLQSMRANKTKTIFWADIFFWKFGYLPPIGGLEYMQIFSPISPLERKIWAFEVRSQHMPPPSTVQSTYEYDQSDCSNQKKLRDKKKKPDQTRRRRTIALHPVLHYVPAGCKKLKKLTIFVKFTKKTW